MAVTNKTTTQRLCSNATPGATASPASRWIFAWIAAAGLTGCLAPAAARSAEAPAVARYAEEIQPLLEQYCYGCHGLGTKKGGVALDAFADDASALAVDQRKLWHDVLKNVRSGFMPPSGKPRPTVEESRLLENWIKFAALGIDLKDPDPGRVTVRRLNRVEYRNTVRDLLGVDFDTTSEFPPDDTGHGFDNIGDVLTLSPLLLEKYLAAATAVVAKAVPTVPRVVAESVVPGARFRPEGGKGGAGTLSYYEPGTLSTTAEIAREGRY